jgi:hypothetical protein
MKVVGQPTHYTSGEDYDWLLKVTEKYSTFYLNKPLTDYTILSNSLTHSKRSSTRATWYEIDAAVSSFNRISNSFNRIGKRFRYTFYRHLVWLYCKLIWKQFIREKL